MAIAAAIGVGLQIGGGVFGIVSGLKAAKKAKKIARRNAAAIREQAVDVLVDRDQTLRRFGQQVEGLLGAQKAAQGAAGINPDFGSAAAVRRDTSYFAAIDELTIRENAQREVSGLIAQADIVQRGGTAQARQTQGNTIAGALRLGGSILERFAD